jgi:hypothetical protein
MATSPIYSWPEPDNTDLVKNGALAIRTLGNAIDTTMATMTPKSIVDAKGDIIAASANDTPARLAVGNNGETLVADSSTSTGLRYQENRTSNFIYNSNFDIWQRGTSFTNAGYLADRWNVDTSNSTISRQSTTPPAGATYYMRHTATAGSAYNNMRQYLETADVEQLQGKTVTLSIKLRRNATNTAPFILQLDKSVTTDAGSGATWVAVGTTNITNASIPTGTTTADWYTASLTVAVPNDGTANSLRFVFNYNALVASGSIIDIAQAMMQIGSVVGPYQRQNATIQGELSACQRYYWRSQAGGQYNTYANGGSFTTTGAYINVPYPVTMRVNPTAVEYANLAVQVGNGAITALSSLTIDQQSNFCGSLYAVTGSTWTANQPARLLNNNNTAGYLAFTSEL